MLIKTTFKLVLFALLTLSATHSFADSYNPFNTPVCLTSTVLPWNKIPGKETEWGGNYAVMMTNNCGAPLTFVATTSTEGTFNVYPLNITTTANAATFTGQLQGAYYIPDNQATPTGSTLPYFSGAFQLFAAGKLVTGSTSTNTGDAFNLYYNAGATPTSDGAYPTATNLYWAAIILNNSSWYALSLGPIQPQDVKISLSNKNAPQFNMADLTFTQTAEQLGLPAGTDFTVTLDFSATAFSYLGKYQWDPLAHPVLSVPVSLKTTNDILTLTYTIQPIQAPTSKGFAWQTCTTPSPGSGTLTIDSKTGASFPALETYTCTAGSAVIKHTGIEGMPLKIDDGSVDGLFNDINNLNAAETGVIVGFANILSSGQIELGPYLKTAADIAVWQDNIQNFQDSGHVVLISYGGEESATSKSIWQTALATFNPAPSADQLNCSSLAACTAALTDVDPTGSVRAAAVTNYETLISRYKPNGIDIFVPPSDQNPLASMFTAEVLKTVITTDVTATTENPNFVLSLSLSPTSQQTFGAANDTLMASLANQGVTPTYINAVYRQFTDTLLPKPAACTTNTVTGACIVASLQAYVAEYTAFWKTATIYPGLIPMALQDYSNTVQIWPANIQTSPSHANQLDNIFASILTAQAANSNLGLPSSMLFSYWNTVYDFNGGYVNNSYPSNQYQLELASYANTPYQDPSDIQWNPSQLAVTSFGPSSGTITWSPATDSAPDSALTYRAELYAGDSTSPFITQDPATSPATFSGLASGTSYRVIVTAKDDKASIPVWRTTWLKTSGVPTITWAPNLIAQANADGVSGFANWDCASDSDVTAVLSYTVTIDGGAVVGTVDNENCKVNFTGLKVATTYNVTVSVSDNKSGIVPTTSPAKAAFTTTSTAPAGLKPPTQYTWDPKPDHTGILTFNSATGGMPPYTYSISIVTTGTPAPPSLPFTALTSCPYSDCSQVYTDNMYRVTNMVFGVTYQVSIVATDAAGQTVGMTIFSILDSN